MDRLSVHVLGAGAVGLAYGYLLTARGHEVVHTSLRGSRAGAIPVRAWIAGKMTDGLYTPRFVGPGGRPASDINLFAVPPAACRLYLGRTGAERDVQEATNLIFASVFDPEWKTRLGLWPTFDPTLIFPLITCEYCPEDGLGFITDLDVEVLSRPESDALTGPIVQAMGLRVSSWVGEGRFLARYVQTAAAYAVLSGLNRGLLGREQVDLALLMGVFAEFLDAAKAIHPDARWDFPFLPPEFVELLPALSGTAGSGGHYDALMTRNICWLISGGGRKLADHLEPFRRVWADRPPASADLPARRLLDAVLAAK